MFVGEFYVARMELAFVFLYSIVVQLVLIIIFSVLRALCFSI